MTHATVENATVGLFDILLRSFLDDEFRARIERDEQKRPQDHPGESLLQYDPEDLREVANLAARFRSWVDGRAIEARNRQGKGPVPTDVRPDEMTDAFAALAPFPGHSFGPGGPWLSD